MWTWPIPLCDGSVGRKETHAMQSSQFLQTNRSSKTSVMDMNMTNSVESYPQSTAAYLISAGKMDCGIWEIALSYLDLGPYARTCFYWCMTPLDTLVLRSLMPTSVLRSSSVRFFDPKRGNRQRQPVPTNAQSRGTATGPDATGPSRSGCL
jgi:hypothetical protein